MIEPRHDVVGIGNAIVDVISQTDDSFLDHMGIEKGIMQLVERERAQTLYAAMEVRHQAPGGSVANTLAGLGALGLRTAFIGRVADDALGRFYAEALRASGTDFPNGPVRAGAEGGAPTSRSMIFVTPDGERSMNTYLGISAELGPRDVDEAVPGRSAMLFLEGYLYDRPGGKAAFDAAAAACRAGGGRAGIALSDPFCVTRHRTDFRRLVRGLDYVIGNAAEWRALYDAEATEAALAEARGETGTLVCTRSGGTVTAIRGDERVDLDIARITPVDATGAGDQFAAGFLFGHAGGRDLATCLRMGALAAAEVISHYGPRPEADVGALFKAEGLV